MNPQNAIEILEKILKESVRAPYNNHVVLEKSIEVLAQAVAGRVQQLQQSQACGSTTCEGSCNPDTADDATISNVAFTDPGTCSSSTSCPTAGECNTPPTPRRRRKSTKKEKC